jgi:hypothetical protein
VILKATATHFEALPPKIWEALKLAVISIGNQWGVRLVIEDDLTVRDAEHRYGEMVRNAGKTVG